MRGARQRDPDQELADLVQQLVDRAQSGDSLAVEQVCAAHPEHADELRRLWGAIAVTQAVGRRDPESEPPRTPPPPRFTLPVVLGDYELLEEIGRGGMGIVYRARQISLRREVAVKMILQGDLASAADRQRFLREAEAAARLSHPNIVSIIEAGEVQGHLFLSMRLITGQTLSQGLEQRPIEPRRAAELMLPIARAIDYAHAQGVTHRDLKPSNILIGRSGTPYVADFGLAKHATATTTLTDAIVGTPAYMAPEQAAGARGQVGPASDVYSLGAILYHMLTGRAPFQAASPVDTLMLVLDQDPMPPRMVNSRIDRNLEMITLHCLQKPQDLRYRSAGALADDLQAYLNDEPIAARDGRFGQVFVSWFRETHHAPLLENWGLLWMWHGVVLWLACWATNLLLLANDLQRWHYALLWSVGFSTWAAVFWWWRRLGGPVTFVERQIAHAWAASLACTILLFPTEAVLGLPVLSLTPLLGLFAGSVFLFKAGVLSGQFYVPAGILFLSTLVMAALPRFATGFFGLVAGGCFFYFGWKYHRRTRRQQRRGAAHRP